ncbi:MAG: SCO family protein [Actinomycetota bacterium]|nr:SCO family protein [Actinomycetota bacterium]
MSDELPATTPQGKGDRPGLRRGRAGDHLARNRPKNARVILTMTAAVLALMTAGALSGVLMKSGSGGVTTGELSSRTIPIPKSQSGAPLHATLANLMGLEHLAPRQAPGFRLVDQFGTRVSLSELDRHRVVVLGFMDDRCEDVCPLVAQELVDAYRDLGPTARHIAFVAVNVNAGHRATRWLRAFIAERGHGIASIPDFYYLTGSAPALRSVWSKYHIKVEVAPSGRVVHGEALYFIAPGGTMRYEATPFANLRSNGTGWLPPATITQWGRGIARYAAAVAG